MDKKTSVSNEYNKLCFRLILCAGILVRIIYVLKSTIYDRQYDIGMIDLDAGHTVSGGHLAYIQYIYENMKLADVDPTTVYQFHHPPFHHFVSAVFMRFISLFTSNTDVIEESMQFVPFACSIVTLLAAIAVMKRFKISGRALNFAVAVLCFHPALILLSGSVNNDCMALMFSVLSILFTMKWLEKRDYKNIILMAVSIGLGISTKQNVAEMAFPIGAVLLFVLAKEAAEKKDVSKLILQYATAGFISVPLGMWFYIRNLLKYNMSIMWVYELPNDTWQYTGNIPVINRFLWPVPAEMIDNLKHFKIGCGYNVWMQIMRTSVLGEWDMAEVGKGIKLIAVLLMLAGALIALVAFIYFMKIFVLGIGWNSKLKPLYRVMFAVGYIVVMACYLVFAYKYPQQCSMHFRYIEITLLFQTVALALGYEKIKGSTKNIWDFVLTTFSVLSMLMCAVWCFL